MRLGPGVLTTLVDVAVGDRLVSIPVQEAVIASEIARRAMRNKRIALLLP
jgi:hypothetical protein